MLQRFMPILAAILAVAVFVIDTATPLDIAVAVLYVAVVLLAMDFAGPRGIVVVAGGCAALTVLSYAITHGTDHTSEPALRGFVSLAAIAITAILAVRTLRSIAAVREHANLLDLTHDTIFVRDRDDVITYWNRAATELYGFSREQAVGAKSHELLRTEFPAPLDAITAELERTGRWEGELMHTGRDGRQVAVLSRWALQRDGRGRTAAILETNNDVTGQRAVEDGLHRAQNELAHVSRVATLGELTASIAHEVNQPLAAVVTNGEACLRWLRRDVPDLGEALSSVERMIGNGQRASEVVKRLRALSRKSEPRHVPLAIADVLADAVLLVRRELQAHRVTLAVTVPESLPPLRGDNVQLQQVVINLVMNGIQAMDAGPAGKRRLGIEATRGTGAEAGFVIVSIADSGRGIAASDLDRLFDAFFTTRPQGMGMGLSICRSIVEAHGGRIRAANGTTGGAVFAFSLPILEERAP